MTDLRIPNGVQAVVFDVMETLIPVSRRQMAKEVAKYSQQPFFVEMIDVISTVSQDDAKGLTAVQLRIKRGMRLFWFLLRFVVHAGLLWRLYKTGAAYRDFMRGQLTPEEFFPVVQQNLRLDLTQEVFYTLLNTSLPEPEKHLMKVLEQAKLRGVKVGLLTNIDEVMHSYLRSTHSWWPEMDAIIASHEHGVLKPSAQLFTLMEEELQVSGKEIWFIDNSEENLEVASQQFGWKTLLWQAPE